MAYMQDVCNPAKDLLRNTRRQMEYISVPVAFPPIANQPAESSDFLNGSTYQRLDKWARNHWYTPCKDHHQVTQRRAVLHTTSQKAIEYSISPHISYLMNGVGEIDLPGHSPTYREPRGSTYSSYSSWHGKSPRQSSPWTVSQYSCAHNYYDPAVYRSDKVVKYLAALPPPPTQYRLTNSGRQVPARSSQGSGRSQRSQGSGTRASNSSKKNLSIEVNTADGLPPGEPVGAPPA
uniref:Uncharacterized protein n=1 Tax=Pyramimonas obovata TaxID=1411642 RepID=A0A7S0WLI5_9CHLO|mmetsp:Transcript_29769/g.65029  ORF Transcript_29769/g.65029 Transcript_29769/m.65029 type:complete len:234 (+) Transcript_29769:294-995(+)